MPHQPTRSPKCAGTGAFEPATPAPGTAPKCAGTGAFDPQAPARPRRPKCAGAGAFAAAGRLALVLLTGAVALACALVLAITAWPTGL